jgi:hypothetical protein
VPVFLCAIKTLLLFSTGTQVVGLSFYVLLFAHAPSSLCRGSSAFESRRHLEPVLLLNLARFFLLMYITDAFCCVVVKS